MKKLILLLVCAVLMTVLISMNYLLWDKEKSTQNIASLKNSNESKDASIDVLGGEIKKTKDTIEELNQKILEMETNNKNLLNTITDLREKQMESDSDLKHQNIIIDQLKTQIDLKPFEAMIKKWADSIDKGVYKEAYDLMKDTNNDSFVSDYQNNVKGCKLKSVKLDAVGAFAQGKLVFEVSLEIKLADNAVQSAYVNGINDKFFSMDYNAELGKWLIADITDKA